MYVTGYFQKRFDPTERELLLSKVREDYEKYSMGNPFKLPNNLKGKPLMNDVNKQLKLILEYKWDELELVAIFFNTPGYDEITKDTAAKPVDIISTIGGTLGLFTGFSIISGVEILYFMGRFLTSSVLGGKEDKKVIQNS